MKILIIFYLIYYSAMSQANSSIYLKVGESKKLPAHPQSKVRVGKSKIIKILDSGNYVKVLALKEGHSPLFIGNVYYDIYVHDKNRGSLISELKTLIEKIPFLQLKKVDDRQVELAGHFLKFRDYRKVTELTSELKLELKLNGDYSKDIQRQIAEFIQFKIKTKGLAKVKISFENGLSINVSEQFKKTREYDFLQSLGIQVIYSKKISLSPLIETKVFIAEVNKSFQRKVGIEWPKNIQWKVINNNSEVSLEAMIDLLETQGDGQVLARPTLICRSGEKAHFIAGGEFAIKVRGFQKDGVSWKKHGIILDLSPTADNNKHIRLSLNSEVSFLDNSVNIDGIPGLKTNKISTSVDLLSEQTLVLSGLIKQQQGESYSGLPYFSQIPVLGALFKSKNFLNNKSELLIFLKSKVIYVSEKNLVNNNDKLPE